MENYPKKSKTDKVVDTIHVGAKLLSLDIGQWGTRAVGDVHWIIGLQA